MLKDTLPSLLKASEVLSLADLHLCHCVCFGRVPSAVLTPLHIYKLLVSS